MAGERLAQRARAGAEASVSSKRTPTDLVREAEVDFERAIRGPLRSAEHALASAMVATGFYYDARVRVAQGEVLARLVERVRDIRRFGSAALDLAWTAVGRYDAYFERGVKQWDVAAGALICERAGLRVLELPARDDLPWGILVAPDSLAEHLLELVAGK